MQASIRPARQHARSNLTPRASETDKLTRTQTPQAQEADGHEDGAHENTADDVGDIVRPTQPDDDTLQNAVESAKDTPEEHVFKQQLAPLTTIDEVDLSAPPDPELEVNAIPADIQQVVSYQTPKVHRRRPGNAVALAARNFVVELKVRME